jgi:Tetrapyrrole (Corrin/Porphyrin) Methylases
MPGSLTIVGTGIRFGVQFTPEARAALLRADRVLQLGTDSLMSEWLSTLRPDARSLDSFYAPGKERAETYREMVKAILAPVYEGWDVCAVFYGHAGVFVSPSHEAIRQARAAGYEATMLPAISAEDCLFADLGIDPGRTGCQSYEATNFLLTHRPVDAAAVLILWQVGVLGEWGHARKTDRRRLELLVDRLLELYPTEHEVILYEASPYPVGDGIAVRVSLGGLAEMRMTTATTLVVPPRGRARTDPTVRDRLRLRQGPQ